MARSLTLLRLLAAAVPASSVVIYESLRHSHVEPLPHAYAGNVLGAFVAGSAAAVVSRYLIARIERAHDELALAREREAIHRDRSRLAATLHDDVAQRLFWVSVALDELSREADGAEAPGRLRRRLEPIRTAVVDAQVKLREAIHALRAAGAGPTGTAFWRSVGRMVQEAGLQLDPDVPMPAAATTPPAEVAEEVLAVVGEAVRNVAKHAGVGHVSIRAGRDAGHWWIEVRDRGRGFDPAAPSPGLGLVLMRERAARIGAELAVSSRPGAGTAVLLRLPGPQGGEPACGC